MLGHMTAFLRALLAAPPATPLGRYTQANGVLYMVMGLCLFAFPGIFTALGAEDFEAGEEGLVRTLAFVLVVIGWFYVMGGRTAADSFGLATVVDRVIVVPAFLVPLALTDTVDPWIVMPLAVLDPLLGLGALAIWHRTRAQAPTATG